MQTKEVEINGKKFVARELTLENYPECMDAFEAMASKDRKTVRDAFLVILEKCTDTTKEDRDKCTLREMVAASAAFMQINGLVSEKKAEAEAASPTDTASEQ